MRPTQAALSGFCDADGGRYAEASLLSHQATLTALHAFVSQQQQQQHSQLAALHSELSRSLQEAQDKIQQLLPSHKQDMALVELLAQHVEGARKKATAALSSNSQAADGIDGVLSQLRDCLGKAAGVGQAQPDDAKAGCQQLLTCVGDLRRQLLRQSKVCDFVCNC